MLESGEGTSSSGSSFFLQKESEDWGGLVDMTAGGVEDKGIIHLLREPLREVDLLWMVIYVTAGFRYGHNIMITVYLYIVVQVTSASSKAMNLRHKTGKTSETSARVLSNLFPSHRSSAKRKFDPHVEDVMFEIKRKKKAAIPQKGRTKQVTEVVLKGHKGHPIT